MLRSRGTPSEFGLYGLKNLCAKFDAFTRFVTIFSLTDRTIVGKLVTTEPAGFATLLRVAFTSAICSLLLKFRASPQKFALNFEWENAVSFG